jgi:hypothetical protein
VENVNGLWLNVLFSFLLFLVGVWYCCCYTGSLVRKFLSGD